jgi:hypothetical protein
MKLVIASRLFAASALLGLLIAGPVSGAGAEATKTCQGAKVPVTVGKKTICKPLAKAIPKPQENDARLAHLREVLKFDPAKAVKGKKRKRAHTLQSGYGAAGKKVQKKLLGALPKALSFIDRRGGARSSLLSSGPALASSGCDVGPAGPTGHTGGASVGLLGDNGGYIDASAGHGFRVRVTFVSCRGANSFHIPDCPTANGTLEATAGGEFRATIEIWDGDNLVSRNSSTFEGKAKAHGEVGPDAKLKSIDVEHTQEIFIVASGGIVIRGGVTRKVRIAMPGGAYDPAAAGVRYFGDQIASDSGASAFADTTASALSAYKGAEPRWSTFNPGGGYCAEPVFVPDSNALKLKKGDKKQLGIYAKARQDGGRATGAIWSLVAPLNASFNPGASNDAAPNFDYTVTNIPVGDKVKVTVKFTSTAGVGEGAWIQPIEAGQAINHLTGTFGGFYESPGGTVHTWSGSANFDRIGPSPSSGSAGIYEMTSGSASLTVSGETRKGEPEYTCQVSGSLAYSELGKLGSSLVSAVGPETGPFTYEYSLEMFLPGTEPPEPTVEVEFSSCGEKSDELNGTTDLDPPHWKLFFFEGQNSPDGLDFSGEIDESSGETTKEQHWSFHGSP